VAVAPGDVVESGARVAVLEAMKMEVDVVAPRDGVVERVLCAPGDLLAPGQPILTLVSDAGARR
jgi:biotin carboxyl carrier protein